MKNKLFIIVTCFSLLAFTGVAGAQPTYTSDAERLSDSLVIEKPDESGTSTINDAILSVREHRVTTFTPQTLLLGQRLDTCGNGAIEEGEQCEFKDGVEIEVPPVMSSPVAVSRFPTCTGEGEICNPDTCRCEIVPICGDGYWLHMKEQCESVGSGGEPVSADMITKMCRKFRSSFPNMPEIAAGSSYLCDDCICVACGNGVKDPGEECDGTAGCNSECKMAPQPEPEPQKIKCTMTERGALEADYINELNAQAKAIMSEAAGGDVQVDIFGESVYSEMLMQIEFPNTSFKGEITDQNILSKVAKSGDSYVTGTGFYQLGGPIYDDLSKVVRMDRQSLLKAVYLFPRANAGTVAKGAKSLIGGSEVFIPDVSASLAGVEILDDLSSAGFKDTEVTVVDANQGSLNSVLRFMVVAQPLTTTTKAPGDTTPQLGSKTAILDAKTWFAPGGWADPKGDLIHHDPNEVLAALQEVVNQLKSEGRQSEIGCGIMNLVLEQMEKKGQKYEAQMISKFAVVSGSLKVNLDTANLELGEQKVVRPTFATVHTISGAGGAGTGPMSCSIASAQAHAPQILVTLGMMVTSIAGVGIIRRRKR